MKKLFGTLLIFVLAIGLLSGCNKKDEDTTTEDENITYLTGLHHAVINIKNYGEITVELDANNAPITVTNFVNLVNDGFYNELTIHRVVEGFLIQGGDPNGDGSGGSGKKIKGEFSSNGVENPLKNTRGAIAMARKSGDYNSATSQFFILQDDYSSLDGEYAVFGYVTEGIEVVDTICKYVSSKDDIGTVEKEDQPVISTITMID